MDNGNWTAEMEAAARAIETQTPRDIFNKEPYFEAGTHLVVIHSLTGYHTDDKGPSAKLVCEVVESTVPGLAGELRAKIWNLTRPAKFPTQPRDSDFFQQFLRAVVGRGSKEPTGDLFKMLMVHRVQENLLRGVLVKVIGVKSKKSDYVTCTFENVAQEKPDVARRRAILDSVGSLKAGGNAAPAPAAPPAPAPAPSLLAQIPGFDKPVAPPAPAAPAPAPDPKLPW